MSDSLIGKASIVTGASRDTSRATAERLANDGSHGGEQLRHKREEANAAVEAIEARGGQALAIQADIARLRRQVVRVATVGTVLNFPGGTCYFGSKAAVEQFCRVLAKEVAPRGITVSVVPPGFTQTKMLGGLTLKMDPGAPQGLLEITRLRRFGQPEEIAKSSLSWSVDEGVGSPGRTSPPRAE